MLSRMLEHAIDLNNFRENKFQYAGLRPCPCYGEDGVFLKIFDEIGVSKNPECVEFGELRSLGTTTRSFRISQNARALYFSGTMDVRSIWLNVIDVLKISWDFKSLRFLKFFRSMPSKGFATPETIGKKIRDFATNHKEIDLFVIDIDSFDYEIMQSVFNDGTYPRVVAVEYNPSLPHDIPLFWPYQLQREPNMNPRLYGASFKAWDLLMAKQRYSLVHISGFCNLIYIRGDIYHPFTRPSIEVEITDTLGKITTFCENYCLPNFRPSWCYSEDLQETDLQLLSDPVD